MATRYLYIPSLELLFVAKMLTHKTFQVMYELRI